MGTGIGQVVTINISRETKAVTQAGFGVPMIFGTHTQTDGDIASYTSITDVAEDFDSTDAEYKLANTIFSQQVSPPLIKIGKRVANVKQDNKIEIATIADTTDYTITINTIVYTFTSGAGASASSIVDGLVAALAQGIRELIIPAVTTDNGDDFDLEASTSGIGFSISVSDNLTLTETLANISVATELSDLIEGEGADDWFALFLASNNAQDIEQAAEWCQSRSKLFLAHSLDTEVKIPVANVQTLVFSGDFVESNVINLKIDGVAISPVTYSSSHSDTINALAVEIQSNSDIVTAVAVTDTITITAAAPRGNIVITEIVVTLGAGQVTGVIAITIDGEDIGYVLENNNYNKTAITYTSIANNELAAAWGGLNLPEAPGSITWKFKQLTGVAAESYTASERANFDAVNVNYYSTVGGLDIMREGTVGNGEFIDIIRGIAWLEARLEEAIYSVLVANKKIPYSDAGVGLVTNAIMGVLEEATNNDLILRDATTERGTYTITAPKVSTVSSANKANRILPDINFTAKLAGAIHFVEVSGNVTV